MIFNVPGHIEMIRNGLYINSIIPFSIRKMAGAYIPIVKTQTRRLNRGYYQVGRDYAVHKRSVKAEPDIRIVMDRIWKERYAQYLCCYISEEDAIAEGGYTISDFEDLFRKCNPKWDGPRWAFEFHVIEVRRNVPGITSNAREERVKRTFYPEQTEGGYPRL